MHHRGVAFACVCLLLASLANASVSNKHRALLQTEFVESTETDAPIIITTTEDGTTPAETEEVVTITTEPTTNVTDTAETTPIVTETAETTTVVTEEPTANVTEAAQEPELTREQAAMLAYQEEQARKAEENQAILEQGFITAEEAVEEYLAANDDGARVDVLANLLRNADGIAFKYALNTLMMREGNDTESVQRIANRAFGHAVEEGFAANTAEALAFALTVHANEGDHVNVLDVLLFRKNRLNRQERGSGCTFIHNLFTDADQIAFERGDSNLFVEALVDPEYDRLVACFLDECTGVARRCCGQDRALNSGMCRCHEDEPDRCDYNIFTLEPHPIWVCSAPECGPNEKCLCPVDDE